MTMNCHLKVQQTQVQQTHSSFSGRSYIWDFVSGWIRKSPWFGYGWGNENIWTLASPIGSHIAAAWVRRINWNAPLERLARAHSSYLEASLYLGSAGVFLILLLIVTIWLRSLNRFFKCHGEITIAWPAVVVLYLTIFGITEPNLVAPSGVFLLFSLAFLGRNKCNYVSSIGSQILYPKSKPDR